MHEYQLFLFGFPRLERNGQPLPVNRRKMLGLLSYLLMTGQPHSREALATLFWPDFDTSSALANLRRDLSRLKETLGEDILRIEREKIQVQPEANIWVDVLEFDRSLRQAEEHGHFQAGGVQPVTCPNCLPALESAAVLAVDRFMAGFNLPDSPEFDEWQFFQGETLRGRLADVLIHLAHSYAAQGSYEKAIEPARRWQALDPLHEPAHRLLMQLYAWAGQPSAALRQYKVLESLLEEELGAQPEAETMELYEAIRARRLPPPAAAAALQPKLAEQPTPLPAADRFQLETLLSTGGFGEIYLGRDRQTGKAVAIKRLLPQRVANPEAIERFVREGQALGQLSHPNIVPMLAFYQHDSTYNLVMEYLPGGTLRDLLEREHSLPVARAIEIALELADALSRAHHLHILHRDLKPENILLDTDSHPRLIDFGLALLQGSDARLTQAGMLLGSPAYMSPEAIQGQELDARSDVWSFGVLLFEMLAGRPPFDAEQIHTLLHQIINQPPPSLREFCPGVPAPLEQLIERMLEKERGRRLPSMRQAAAELEAIRDGKVFRVNTGREAAGSTEGGDIGAQGAPEPTYMVNLPPQPTPFLGRQSELANLFEMLGRPEVRLVTLVATGGTGKTRLAVEAASRLAKDMPNGAVFVPLAAVSSSEFILPAIANALHFRFSPGADPKDQIALRLKELKILLVLDNFEHLLGAAPLVSDLLAAAADLKVLVTSRERLDLVEEWVYELGGLPFPKPGDTAPNGRDSWLKDYSAVQLFVDRARRVSPGLELDGETLDAAIRICQLVEGMPLALELAAPLARAMTFTEIAQELTQGLDILSASMRNLPDRHRSVRLVFDQTWQSLTPIEQGCLARLSVFHNGCTREAAVQVAMARPVVLMTLVDKALLRHRGSRFEMHELVRQYAAERLSQDPREQEATLDRHYQYYLDLLGSANAGLKGGRQLETSLALIPEIDNVRAAWNRVVERNNREVLYRAAEPYWLYNEFRGTLAQGAAAFRQAREAIERQDGDPSMTGFLYAAEGSLLARQWHLDEGRALMLRGLALLRSAEPLDLEKTAFALAWYSLLNIMSGKYPEAAETAQESLSHFAQTGDRWTQAAALRLMGASALYRGEIQRAQEYLNQCVAACKVIGELRIRTYATSNLGVIHLWYGQLDEARRYFDESLRISKTCNDRLSRADALSERVRFYIAAGEYERAEETARKSIQVYHELGRTQVSLANIMLGKALRLQGKPGAEEALLEGLAAARSVNHQPDIASGLEGLGNLAVDREDFDQAQRYFREALDIWTEIGNEPEIATLLCRLAFGMLASGTADRAEIREMLVRVLRLARKHRSGAIAVSAMVGLATLQMQASEYNTAAPVLYYARRHPSAPQEIRTWVERVLAELPPGFRQTDNISASAPWTSMVERWEHQLLLEM